MKVSECEIGRYSRTAVPTYNQNFQKSSFKDSKQTGHLRIFSSGNKHFIRKRVSQSPKSSAKKLQAKMV